MKDRIKELQKEKDVAILAHYYVDGEVQKIADYVGDSFYLAKTATKLKNKTIIMAGVYFMGESIKILNPEKTVHMVDVYADCPMAHMITIKKIKEMREKYDDLAVVCYINSTAEIKAYCDVCITSSNALKIVSKLKEKNIDVFMITGDSEVVARKVANKLGINNVLYEVMPNEKSQKVVELQKQGKVVAMVGDGINDAPALASADISFAMGTGTDIAMETSDITLMNGNLSTLLKAINISEQTLKVIKQNLFWAFFYNVIAIPFAAFGYLNPMLAGFTMSFSSVSVVLNSLRLKRYKF